MYTWIWVVVALLLGALLGGAGVFLFARRWRTDAARAMELQRELDGYRQEVSDHFVQTAGLVNDLTRSYKAVYDHLEQGAYRLVDEETLRKQLGNVDAKAVRLEYFGRRNKAAVLGSGADTVEPLDEVEGSQESVGSSEREEAELFGEMDASYASGDPEDGEPGSRDAALEADDGDDAIEAETRDDEFESEDRDAGFGADDGGDAISEAQDRDDTFGAEDKERAAQTDGHPS